MTRAARAAIVVTGLIAGFVATPARAQQPVASDADVARLAQALRSPFDQQNVDAAVESLARAGIVVGRNSDLSPMLPVAGRRSIYRYIEAQARSMAFQIAGGGGTPGSLLNAAIPGLPLAAAPNGVIPISAVIAGYVREGQTFGARLSRAVMNNPDARRHASLAYPHLVVALFLADVGGAAPSLVVERPVQQVASLRPGFGYLLNAAAQPGGDPCLMVDEFLNNMGSELRDLLSPEDTSLFGAIGRGVAFALGIGVDVVVSIVRRIALDNPAIFALRQAIGGLAVLTQAASLINPWVVTIEPQPAALHYGIDSPADAAFTASVQADMAFTWPQPVQSCAKLLAIDLPEITQPAGAEIQWTPGAGFGEHAEGSQTTNTLSDGATDRYEYVSHAESSDDHVGPQKDDGFAEVTATVARPELEEIKNLAFRFAGFPGLAGLVPDSVLEPIRSLTDPVGSQIALIHYHEPSWTGTVSVRRTTNQTVPADNGRMTVEIREEWSLTFNGPGRAQSRGSLTTVVTHQGKDCTNITKINGAWSGRGGKLTVLGDKSLSIQAEAPEIRYTESFSSSGCDDHAMQMPASTASQAITFEIESGGRTSLNGTTSRPTIGFDGGGAINMKGMQIKGDETITYQLVQNPRTR